MADPKKLIHTMLGSPNGDRIDLGDWYSQVTVTARAACNVKAALQTPGSDAPDAPAATPVPANGAEADGYNDMSANDVDTFAPDATGRKKYRYVLVWEKAAGILQVEAI